MIFKKILLERNESNFKMPHEVQYLWPHQASKGTYFEGGDGGPFLLHML